MDKGLKAKLQFEIAQIDKLLDNCKPLLDLCKLKKPDFIEMSACAMVLHSFYNGIEKMMVLLFKHYDGNLTIGSKWHTELLDRSFVSDESRKQFFSDELHEPLEEYLKFRHFVRHSYGFQLEWERMEELVNGINTTWETVKENINNFIENG